MELTFVVAVKGIWQLLPSWLHPCKVCDQGRRVGKIKFTRNRKMVGGLVFPPRNIFFRKVGSADKKMKSRTHTGVF